MSVTPQILSEVLLTWILVCVAYRVVFISVRRAAVMGRHALVVFVRDGRCQLRGVDAMAFTACIVVGYVIDELSPPPHWFSQPLTSGWAVGFGVAVVLLAIAQPMLLLTAGAIALLAGLEVVVWLEEPLIDDEGSRTRGHVMWQSLAAIGKAWRARRRVPHGDRRQDDVLRPAKPFPQAVGHHQALNAPIAISRRVFADAAMYALPTPVVGPGNVPRAYPDHQFPIASNDKGDVLSWEPAVVPHQVIAGSLAAGKTMTAQNLIVEATYAGWQVNVLREFDREYNEFVDWPGVRIATTAGEQGKVIGELSERGVAGVEEPPVLLIIDTVTGVLDGISRWSENAAWRARKDLVTLIENGGAARVHVVVVADPTSDQFPLIEAVHLLPSVELTAVDPGRRVRRDFNEYDVSEP